MDRFCPNCKIRLGGYDHFYCTSCGYTLDEKLISRENVFKRVADFAATANDVTKKHRNAEIVSFKKFVGKILNTHVLIFLSLLIVVLSTGIYSYKHNFIKLPFLKSTPPLDLNAKTNGNSKIIANTISSPIDFKIASFSNFKLLENVPNDAKIIVVGQDIASFAKIYESFDTDYSQLSESLKGKAEDSFVFFASTPEKSLDSKITSPEYVWSLIILPLQNDISFSSELLDKYSWLRVWKNSPILLITPSEYVLSQVAESKSGTAQNFTHTTFYSSSKYLFNQEAKLLIYVSDKDSQDYLNSFLSDTKFNEEVRLILDSVVKSKPGVSIIK